MARLQFVAGDLKGARFTLDKTLAERPDYVPAMALLAELDLASGDLSKAEQRAKTLVVRNPASEVGYRISGDIALARRNYPDAIQSYRAALDRSSSGADAVRLSRAHMEAGAAEKGTALLEGWLKTRPDDSLARRALAEGYVRAGDLAAAQAAYEILLQGSPEDVTLLNNYANVLLRRSDARALEVAQKAFKLAPSDASVQDTVGWILVQRGELESGIRHLRDARLRAPNDPDIRFHLAAALAKAGRPNEARQELEAALKTTAPFESSARARELAATLGRL